MSNLPPEGHPVLPPWTGPRTLACVETIQRPLSPCPLLPSAPGLSAAPEPPFCSQLFRGIQHGMLEAGNLVSRTAPCPPPAEWGHWLPAARHPPGAAWKAYGTPPICACPEHGNAGGSRVLSHSPLSPTPTALQNSKKVGSNAREGMDLLAWQEKADKDQKQASFFHVII